MFNSDCDNCDESAQNFLFFSPQFEPFLCEFHFMNEFQNQRNVKGFSVERTFQKKIED